MNPPSRIQSLESSGLYLVTDDRLPLASLLEKTRQALEAGVRVVQFRDKRATKRELLARGAPLRDLCAARGALFLVNDHLDVALALEADGVHVGQDDFPADRARALLGSGALLGLSVSAVDEAVAAPGLQVDYLGVGAMYPTDTKPDAEYGGLELLRAVRRQVPLPLVGIGGITLERAPEVIAAGADGVAVVSAVYGAPDAGLAAERLLAAIAAARGGTPPNLR
ncbi:MAG: thiamine phosphate synthase [Chloroflexi bacterium]|nr:thiamine phosphate synthase [Chloroflexota bacterium]